MIFIFTRIVQCLILPPASLLILMFVGFLLVSKKRVLGILCIGTAFILLFGLSTTVVSEYLIEPLENVYPPLKDTRVDASAIVVLSGGVRDLAWVGLVSEPSEVSMGRTVKGVSLYRTLHIPLLFVGGNGKPVKQETKEAPAMAHVARDLGVPLNDVRVEATARNTAESAVAVKRMLARRRIILVTSAYHMKRAVPLFRKQGFDVIPAPTGYRAERQPATWYSFVPSSDNLYSSAVALSEYISYQWYSWRGDL